MLRDDYGHLCSMWLGGGSICRVVFYEFRLLLSCFDSGSVNSCWLFVFLICWLVVNCSETFTGMIMLAQPAMLCYVKIFWGGFHNFLNIIGWKFSLRFVQYEFWLRWWNIFVGRLRDFIIRRKMIVVGILPEGPCLFRRRVRGGGKAWGSMLWWQTQGWWLMRLVLNEMFGPKGI